MLTIKEASHILHLVKLLTDKAIVTNTVRDDRCPEMITQNSTLYKEEIRVALVCYLQSILDGKSKATEVLEWEHASKTFM